MKRTTQLSPSVITPQKALILALFVLLILFASSLSIAGAASGPDVIDLTDPNNPGTVSSTWTCGAGGNDYTVFGDTTVIGFVYDEEVSLPALSFAVSEDVTLHWQAYYVGIAPIGSALVTYTGLGTFQVEDGELLSGWISNMGTGAALRASGSSVIVSGTSSANCGMISANSASAILGDGPSTTVTIKGYGSVFGDERSNLHSVINMTNESNIGTNVIISDNGSVYAIAEATMGYAIQTYGNVLMYGGRVYTLSSAGRGINLIGANSTATINGGKVYVDGGPSSTAISTATTTPATVPSASVIINGGEVSATAGYAIRTTGVSSVVEINGGIVSATTGNAVRSESTSPVSAAVNITDGFVFAYSNGSGDRITGGGNVIFLSGGLAPAIARPAVVCSLNTNAYPLPATFIEGTSTGLTFVPAGASATWATGTPNDGIDYSNDTNTGFFPLTDVTVAALTNFGLVFDVANQTLLVDVDGSLTPTAADIICPGQGETWTASDSILYLNDFSWNTPARVVLSVYRTSSVLYPAEINLSGVNELISSYEGAEASYGITTFDGVVIFSGYGDLTVTSGTSTDSSSTGINAAIEIYVLGTPTLTVTGGDAATSSRGIDTDTFSLDKGTVVATGTTAEGSSSGLVVGNALYLEGGSLTAIGGDAPESYGIECPAASSLNINSGHLIAEGGTLAISNSTITVNLPSFYKWRGVIYPASLPEMIVIYPGSTNQPYIHGDPFNYVEIMSTRMAVVGDKTVSGFVGRALPGTDTATITLYGDELAADLVDLDVSSWFVDLPTGVVVLANGSEGGSSITLTFSGTPTEVSDAVFDISIPASVLASGVALHLDSNANARFDIIPVYVEGVSLADTEKTVLAGESFTLVATIAPTDATNKNVTWSSSDPTVATVDSNGVVTTHKFGTATITVTTEDGSYTATCLVTAIRYATVADTTVAGFIGRALPGTDTAVVTLFGEWLSAGLVNVNATGWFSNLPIGVTVTASGAAGSDTITFTFNGTPAHASAMPLSITIPASALESGVALVVESNPNARFDIVPVDVEGVTLSETEKTVLAGESFTLVATTTPLDATNQNVTWTTSDPSVATVDQDGNVTTHKRGTATITVTTEDGGYSASCTVTATSYATIADKRVAGFIGRALPGTDTAVVTLFGEWLVSDLVDVDASSWFASLPTGVVVHANGVAGSDTLTLTFTGTPTQVLAEVFDITIPASVLFSGEALAVDLNENALFDIVPVAVEGIKLSEIEKTLKVGEKFTLIATITPEDATNKNVIWTSSDPSVAIVDEFGNVTALKVGKATITAMTEDGQLIATCEVTVVKVDDPPKPQPDPTPKPTPTTPKAGDILSLDRLLWLGGILVVGIISALLWFWTRRDKDKEVPTDLEE